MQTTPQTLIDEYTARGWWGRETLDSLLHRAVAECPERPALIDPPNRPDIAGGDALRLTWAETGARVDGLAAALHATGLRADDIAVVQLPNIAELALAYLALARLGAIVSPVPVQYGPHELKKIQSELSARAFLSLGSLKGRDLLAEHADAFPGCLLYGLASPSAADAIDIGAYVPGTAQREAWLDHRQAFAPDANDIFTICWTSGTTGTPKGVPRSANHWLAISRASGDLAGLQDGDALLNPFPMVNMGGLGGFFFNWLTYRATLVLHHPLDLEVYLRQLQAEKINYTIAPPALLNMLLREERLLAGIDLTHLRAIGSGSAPLAPWMIRGYEEKHGIAILNNFGSNEGMCLASGPRDVPDPALRGELFPRFGVAGYEWSNRAAAMISTRLIEPETGARIEEPGVPGELLFKGPTIFDGYWKAPRANAEVFTWDGYFRTGDLFEIAGPADDPRYYRFVGRRKDIIVRGGMNVSPAELDTLLAGHPDLADAAVFGAPDPVLGERIAVAVVVKPGHRVVLDDIVAFLQEKGVAVFKLPEMMHVFPELPRNALEKVLRHELVAATSSATATTPAPAE
ncbi:MAG: class I adenylate-forming enzyme family protein [Gammaproteobacteria bacterium]|nr:class I adenylate-forming enzyme family protein [Gammaproteobacteria bacterium]MDE0364095.1 class I adenylate-forming enzyme family protein [Gammaproteobacteria bacterium]